MAFLTFPSKSVFAPCAGRSSPQVSVAALEPPLRFLQSHRVALGASLCKQGSRPLQLKRRCSGLEPLPAWSQVSGDVEGKERVHGTLPAL